MKVEVRFKQLHQSASLPQYQTIGSAAVDLKAILDKEITIKPNETVLIGTGLAMEMPDCLCAKIYPRSGMGIVRGLVLANLVGIIDSDYRGEIKVALWNRGTEPQTIGNGDRIAQMVFEPIEKPNFSFNNELSKTSRGEGGFGSTGK